MTRAEKQKACADLQSSVIRHEEEMQTAYNAYREATQPAAQGWSDLEEAWASTDKMARAAEKLHQAAFNATVDLQAARQRAYDVRGAH